MAAVAPANPPRPTGIAIVGGGMLGASLALLLARAGFVVDLIERQPPALVATQPSFDDRATALSASSRLIYAELGLWSAIAAAGAAIDRVHVSDRGHLGQVVLDRAEQGGESLGLVVPNRALGQILWQALLAEPGVRVHAAEVTALTPRRDGYDLVLAHQSAWRAGLVVIADGAASQWRSRLGIACERTDYRQHALITTLGLAAPHGGTAYERFTDAGPMALLPLPPLGRQQRAALVWTLEPSAAASAAALPEADFLHQVQQGFGFRAGAFTQVGQRLAYPLSLTLAREQVRSHLAVMGNAAHSLHPVAGQGFNLSLRDAAALTAVLSGGRAADRAPGELALLQQYVQRQHDDQAQTIAFSDQLVRLFGGDSKALGLLRAGGLLALDALPGLRQGFARRAMGLGGRRDLVGVAHG